MISRSTGNITDADIANYQAQNITTNIRTLSSASLGGLHVDDENRLHSLNVQLGVNSFSNNGLIWIGNDGYMKFTFYNMQSTRLILCIWREKWGFLDSQKPEVTISIDPYQFTHISVANGVKWNAFSAIYPDTKVAGQIYNTWGEFSVDGPFSTVDVSREPLMNGHPMDIYSYSTRCRANMNTCAFVCKNKDRCGETQEYDLINCGPTNGGSFAMLDRGKGPNPEGGCMMGAGGNVDVLLK
jgi:hypothetical protein